MFTLFDNVTYWTVAIAQYGWLPDPVPPPPTDAGSAGAEASIGTADASAPSLAVPLDGACDACETVSTTSAEVPPLVPLACYAGSGNDADDPIGMHWGLTGYRLETYHCCTTPVIEPLWTPASICKSDDGHRHDAHDDGPKRPGVHEPDRSQQIAEHDALRRIEARDEARLEAWVKDRFDARIADAHLHANGKDAV